MGSEKLGNDVRKARKKAKLTQEEAAKKADITTTYFAQIERGEVNPSYDVVVKIAKVLNTKFSIPG